MPLEPVAGMLTLIIWAAKERRVEDQPAFLYQWHQKERNMPVFTFHEYH
jgi:hypothetical protein